MQEENQERAPQAFWEWGIGNCQELVHNVFLSNTRCSRLKRGGSQCNKKEEQMGNWRSLPCPFVRMHPSNITGEKEKFRQLLGSTSSLTNHQK